MNRTLHKHLVACALLVGMGIATAQAQPAPTASAPAAQGRHFDPARMAERVNRHLAALKQKLQISAAQETAWTSFATAMQPPANMQRPDRQAMANMTTPERIDQMRAMRDRRNAEMDRRAEATKAFYAQLTPEQKKTFDSETARMGHGHGHGMRGDGQQGGQMK
ncbi:MAG: Spy/CpxP family protein refolding chaperone [Ramlibacter sp.]